MAIGIDVGREQQLIEIISLFVYQVHPAARTWEKLRTFQIFSLSLPLFNFYLSYPFSTNYPLSNYGRLHQLDFSFCIF